MCGIFGFYKYRVPSSRRFALNTLLGGLRQLEYRGYDSAGVCIDGTDKQFLIVKETGKVDRLAELATKRIDATGAVPLGDEVLLSQAGIGHTRWATHGRPAAINSHPHTSSSDNEFVVVHNGIITNYQALKDFLVGQGETFQTQTDTEVIPKLCKVLHKRLSKLDAGVTFIEVVMEVVAQLEGAFALLIKSTLYPGELAAAKKGSPLLLGLVEHEVPELRTESINSLRSNSYRAAASGGSVRSNSLRSGSATFSRAQLFAQDAAADDDDAPSLRRGSRRQAQASFEAYFSSDASALVKHTRRVITLQDDDLVHMAQGNYAVYNMKATSREKTVERVHQTLEMEVAQIMKGNYDHYMLKEIHEQPDSITQTLMGRISGLLGPASPGTSPTSSPKRAVNPFSSKSVRVGGLTDHLPAMRRSRRMVFVACGTSYHAAMACRQTIEQLADMPVALELASDLLDRRAPIFRDDMCVFVSQSGETADTLQALLYAKQQGALCVGITNTVGSAIAIETDCGIHVNAGCEIGVASTKAYTSQIVAMTLLALVLAEDSYSHKAKYDAVVQALRDLPASVAKALLLDGRIRELAEDLKHESSMLVFGRGHNYATALETALKIKEVALIHSEGVLAGEMKHGTLALVDETLPILVVATRDSCTYRKMASVIEQLAARDARLVILCNEGDPLLTSAATKGCQFIEVPEVEESVQPVVNIVPLQLLSYHLTVLRGFNVDQPRNLAKSVTVTEE